MIRFITSGISTTIQDLGRFGYRKMGVPLSGAMDQTSSRHANEILGNDANDAVLEMVVKGPILFFEKDCWIALSGATIEAELAGKQLSMNEAILIEAGQELKLGNIKEGRYSYLAVKGGIQSEVVMGSRSMFHGITEYAKLTKGMVLEHLGLPYDPQSLKLRPNLLVFANSRILVHLGPEFELLSFEIQQALLNAKFKISPNSNRVGLRLETETKLSAQEILTSPVFPGVVQLTPAGELIVLGRDAGVSGGYARVLVLQQEQLSQLSQVVSEFVFQVID